MAIDKGRGAPPIYQQIAREIGDRIERGEYGAGAVIPSEKQLESAYGVSRMTVRLAIGELAHKGYVEKMRGIGTVVTFGKIEEDVKGVVSFTDEMAAHGIAMSTDLCEIKKTIALGPVAAALKVAAGTQVFELTRLRCANGKPLVYSVTWLPRTDLPLDPSVYADSLYAFLREKCGVLVARGEDVLEATLAEGTVARQLRVAGGFPTFKRTRVTYDREGAAIEYSVCYYPGDKYKYRMRL